MSSEEDAMVTILEKLRDGLDNESGYSASKEKNIQESVGDRWESSLDVTEKPSDSCPARSRGNDRRGFCS